MLEKPNLHDHSIATCLRDAYGLRTAQITFLPLGADQNTAVYRAVTADGAPYFVKLRHGDFDEIAVTLPRYLHDYGIAQVIAPLAARSGQLWTDLDGFRLILYPFVEGRNGYQVDLLDRQWVDLGAALKAVHTTPVPPALKARIPQETYAPRWRERARAFAEGAAAYPAVDAVAARLAACLEARREEILDLVAAGRAPRPCAPGAPAGARAVPYRRPRGQRADRRPRRPVYRRLG